MRSGLLTSGCLHDQINEPIVKPTNVEKCSHDGILDEASHLRAISGIKSIYSPHSDLNYDAVNLVVVATERFFND
ncbi:unnamed protein product [Rotaria magnacalcarata]